MNEREKEIQEKTKEIERLTKERASLISQVEQTAHEQSAEDKRKIELACRVMEHAKALLGIIDKEFSRPEDHNARIAAIDMLMKYLNNTYIPNVFPKHVAVQCREQRRLITEDGVILDSKDSPMTIAVVPAAKYAELVDKKRGCLKPLINAEQKNDICKKFKTKK